eukprot:TRINITY_DN2145_c0_g1_i3.p1 TRINITY_DN2145_c0_g1~~TRINITY_DN2145_c0_g1_i3.p1  ORF type:complete len:751 (-),score=138.53 TRINITY_DN2145_c0_g1_i3:28-2106(-)
MDFDSFFEREDALWQLQSWRKALASGVLGLPSASLLRLSRIRRGSLDLEFTVEVGSGLTDAELQERVNQEADRLRQLFAEPVLEVRVGAVGDEAAWSPEGHRASASSSPRAIEEHHLWERGAELLGEDSEPEQRPPTRRGRPQSAGAAIRPGMERLNHPTIAEGPRFLRDDWHWKQREGQRIRELRAAEERQRNEEKLLEVPRFQARPVPASVSTPRFQAVHASSASKMSAHRAKCQELLGQDGCASARGAGARGRAAKPAWEESDEKPPPFRARPVPWQVSMPLYEQMVREEKEQRQERQRSRSLDLLRSSSLPPRLEHESRARRRPEQGCEQDADGDESPVQVQRWRGEFISAHGHELAKFCSSCGAGFLTEAMYCRSCGQRREHVRSPGEGRGLIGRSSEQTRRSRASSAPRQRRQSTPEWPLPVPTTEVPDFAARHERLKHQLERRKYLNRYVTQPEPFIQHSTKRSSMRQPPMVKDPTKDWRFNRPNTARASSAGAVRRSRPDAPGGVPPPPPASTQHRGGDSHFSIKALEQPSQAVPPRTTEKVLSAQQATQRRLQERRERELREREQAELAREVPAEMKLRVQQAVGPVEDLDDKIDRITHDKKQGLSRIQREKLRDLQQMKERVNRRPLLMEQADSLVRARRRALFRVRNTLKEAGVQKFHSYFREEELDEFDRAKARGEDDEA